MPSFSLMPHSQTILRAMSRRLLDVAAGAVGHVAEDNFLGDAAAHGDDEIVEQLVLAVRVFVLLGQTHRRAERRAARDDRHLVQRIGVLEQHEQDGVTGFVLGGVLSFPFRSSPGCGAPCPSAPCRALLRARRA